MKPALECTELCIAVGERVLVNGLCLSIQTGETVGVLGPNGVGKTLTLHTMAGLRERQGGDVSLQGERLEDLDRAEVARRLGLLLQTQDDPFPTTVRETALMGRHPRISFWQWESSADIAIAEAALREMDLGELPDRLAGTLSGGERQRLALAMLLAQDPAVMLLDEPLNHLDPLHRLSVLEKLAALASAGKTIVMSLHDPAIAARYTTAVLLLYGDGSWDFGPTADMLTEARMERLYGTPFETYASGERTVLVAAARS